MSKFNVGDKVEIINFGHPIWSNDPKIISEIEYPILGTDKNSICFDIRPELIGEKGIVTEVSITQDIPHYSISGVGAWFYDEQLKLSE